MTDKNDYQIITWLPKCGATASVHNWSRHLATWLPLFTSQRQRQKRETSFAPSASSRSPWLCENEWQSLTLPVSLFLPPPPARLFLSTYLSVLVVGGRGFKDKIHAVSASVCLCLRETGACGQSCLRKCEHVTKCLPVLFTLIPNQFNKASVKPICLPKSSHTTLRSQRWSSNETLF